MADPARRGFWSSFQYVTLIGGQLVALAVLLCLQALLTPSQLESWGWRIPLRSAAGSPGWCSGYGAAWWSLHSSSPRAAAGAPRSSVWLLFRVHPRAAFTVIGLTSGGTLAFYAYSTYMQKYLANTAGFSRETATLICGARAAGLSAAAAGRGRAVRPHRPQAAARRLRCLRRAVHGAAVHRDRGDARCATVAFALVLAALVIVTGYSSINAVVKAELFPAHIRALGVALPYSLAQRDLRRHRRVRRAALQVSTASRAASSGMSPP